MILTELSIYGITMETQGHLQGQKVNPNVKNVKRFLSNTNGNKGNISF